MIIGLSGKMGTGKDYLANNVIIPFLEKHGKQCLQLAFADQIKVNCMTKNNLNFDDVYVEKTHKTRNLLQYEGTENGRNVLGEDIWIKYFDSWRKVFTSRGVDAIVVVDVRFHNEVDYIRNLGGLLIRINAPLRNEKRLIQESGGDISKYVKISSHQSECSLDNMKIFDITIDNDVTLTEEQQNMTKSKLCNCLHKYMYNVHN
jgi:phosphomevalonate kinase